ncbi:MAG TPA: adenylate/guanylate cyclase domain-containing protein [Mycobacteriales bacterium]|nr:adenylate/guanylate cyclase domain-containing protein [Mycobacteriales bacterium]
MTGSALRPYVPRLALEWLRTEPECAHRRIEGSLAFVDISGFTALTERLASRGRVGSEEMSDALNDVFGELLPVGYGLDAQLVKYGGDAVLLLFEGPNHAARACRSAWLMQRAIRSCGRLQTSVGAVRLRMSVGIHTGDIDFYLVGARHRELIVTGLAATVTAQMEKVADAGEIVVSPATADQLPPACVGVAKGDGLLLAQAPRARVDAVPSLVGLDGIDFAQVLPANLIAHLTAAPATGEHRAVVPAFIEFSGIDQMTREHGPDRVADALHELVTVTDRACERYAVTFLASDINADGGKLILVGGAPAKMGDDEQRVLCALREVVDSRPTVAIRCGVTAGRAFAGDFGTAYRRTWSIVGDTVNLAARLMAKAEREQIVAHADLLDRCTLPFQVELLPPFTVKGKREPILAAAVGPVAERADVTGGEDEAPLLGRENELATLAEALADAVADRGTCLQIVGEPGIGKSRLVRELRRSTSGAEWHVATCDLHSRLRPFAALGQLLRTALGVAPTAPPEQVVPALAEIAGRAEADVEQWLPLVGQVVGLDLPPTPAMADLDDEGRAQRLTTTLVALLDAAIHELNVFVVEDAHYIDPASLDVLRRIRQQLDGRGWLLLLVGRDPTMGAETPVLRLDPLPAPVTEQLVLSVCEDEPLLPHVVSAIVQRSAGNPLFAGELAVAAASAGNSDELPDSLESILTTRIDALPSDARHVLRVAAVFGQSLSRQLLDLASAGDADVEGAWPQVQQFLVEDINGNVSFRIGLLRDAAYAALPFRLRRILHARAADALRARGGESSAGMLSFHLLQAGNYDDAFRLALVAAEEASERHALAEAASLYERALEAARHANLEPAQRLDAAEHFGNAAFQLGDLDRAVDGFSLARRESAVRSIERARLTLSTARVHLRAGRLSMTLQWLTRAERALPPDAPEATELRIAVAADRAYARLQQGRYRAAILVAENALAEARASSRATAAVADLYHVLDLAYLSLGVTDRDYATPALAVWEELGNLTGQAGLLNHLGIRAYYRGDWDLALHYYEQGRDAFLRCGHDWQAAIASSNMAEVRTDQGRLEQAEADVRRAIQVFRAVKSSDMLRAWQVQLATIIGRMQRVDEAVDLLDEVRAAAVAEGDVAIGLDVEARQAELHLLAGEGEAAAELLQELVAQAHARQQVQTLSMLHRLSAYAFAQIEDWEAALDAVDQARSVAIEQKAAHDEAFALHARAAIGVACGQPADVDMIGRRDELFDRLGIVQPVTFPLPVILPEQATEQLATAEV